MAEEKIKIKAQKRELFGKKVKKLRREGKLPANIYGRNFKSTAITTDTNEFLRVYKKAGKTSVVYLELDGKELPVLVAQVQYHPLLDVPIHVDFKKVDLKQEVEAEVPIKVVGVSKAIEDQGAELIIQSKSLLVRALPDKIPSEIEVDISHITEPGVEVKVKDIKAGKDYVIVDEPEKTVLVVASHVVEEVEEKPIEEIEEAEKPEGMGKTESKTESESKEKSE